MAHEGEWHRDSDWTPAYILIFLLPVLYILIITYAHFSIRNTRTNSLSATQLRHFERRWFPWRDAVRETETETEADIHTQTQTQTRTRTWTQDTDLDLEAQLPSHTGGFRRRSSASAFPHPEKPGGAFAEEVEEVNDVELDHRFAIGDDESEVGWSPGGRGMRMEFDRSEWERGV